MNHVDVYGVSNILVERCHQKVDVVQKVEFPALCNERVAQQVS